MAAPDRRERGAQPQALRGTPCRNDAARRGDCGLGGRGSVPEAAVLDSERRTELLDAIGRLDDHDRDVLVHRFLLGLDEQETADALAIRRGTVKSRTSRALDRLRAELPEEAA